MCASARACLSVSVLRVCIKCVCHIVYVCIYLALAWVRE